jgi:catechol 2,3-dioxygenase-like lactoylglutathione lyase family enzyme
MLRIATLDHIVLNVRDMDRSLQFYSGVLGLASERVDEYRAGMVPFPSVRVNGSTIIDLFPLDSSMLGAPDGFAENLNHFCLVWEKDGAESIIDYLKGHGIEIDRPPSHAWGARGRGTAIRVHDPDGNLVELRVYTGSTE